MIPRLAAEQPFFDSLGLQPEVPAFVILGHRDLWLNPQAIKTPPLRGESQWSFARSEIRWKPGVSTP